MENSNNKDFTFLDFKPTRGGARKLSGEHQYFFAVSRHTNRQSKSNSYRTAFSTPVSEIVFLKGLTHFRIRRDNITGDLHFIFLKDTSGQYAQVTWEGMAGDNRQVRMYNKELCNFFANQIGIKGDFSPTYWQLSGDLSNSDDYATFKIIKHIED